MADAPKSELDKLKEANLERAAEQIAMTLHAQGVDKVRAAERVEEHVTFIPASGALWYAEADNIGSRGATDAHLIWFARKLHLHHPEWGGTAVPFGNDPGPEPEGVAQQAARIAAARKTAEAARKRNEEQSAELAQQHAEQAAAAQMQKADWRGWF